MLLDCNKINSYLVKITRCQQADIQKIANKKAPVLMVLCDVHESLAYNLIKSMNCQIIEPNLGLLHLITTVFTLAIVL